MAKDIERALQQCFHPKQGKPNLRKVPINREMTRHHIDKAHRNLRAMKMMFDNDLLTLRRFVFFTDRDTPERVSLRGAS